MPTAAVVEVKILGQTLPGLGNRTIGLQIYILIFHTPPKPFYEHIVHPTAFAVHADADTAVSKNLREIVRGELAALVRIEDLWGSILLKRLLQCFYAERSIQGVR